MSQLGFFKHPQAIVESDKIGDGSRIWAFVHVLPGAKIGSDCNICDHVFIENDVLVGDRVTIKSGVQLWDGVELEDDVFIGPNVTFTNDKFPRSKYFLADYPRTIVQRAASVGANATLLPGISIGKNAMVGAGAVVTRDVPPNAVVVGNPARITGYNNRALTEDRFASAEVERPSAMTSLIPGVSLWLGKTIRDLRGNLSANELADTLPFVVRRYFLVFDVPSKEVRGEHAHRVCQQFLLCVSGSCHVVLDDTECIEEYVLERPDTGILLPPMVWGVQYKFSPDAVLLVLASHSYDAADYIRDYDLFLALKQS